MNIGLKQDTTIRLATNTNEKSIGEKFPDGIHEESMIKVYNELTEFEENLPHTVSLLTNEFGSKIYIIGTAHFSEESKDDVSFVIRNVKPDVIMVELCAARVHMLSHDEETLLEEARDISFAKIRSIYSLFIIIILTLIVCFSGITRAHGLMNGIFYILMLNMSAKLVRDLGMAPGGEFRRAVEEMKSLPNPVLHLGDRSINITLQRAFNSLTLWQTVKIVFKLIFSLNNTITREEVEQCKEKDSLEALLDEMAEEYPVFRDVFLTERDQFLCHSLHVAALPQSKNSDGKPNPVKVVGIVGIGHMAGIVKQWGNIHEADLNNILSIPPSSFSNRILKFSLKYGLCTLISYGIYRSVCYIKK